MRKRILKLAAMTLAAAMLTGTCAACGSGANKEESGRSTENANGIPKAESCIYKTAALTEAIDGYYSALCGFEDKVFYIKTIYDNESYSNTKAVYNCNADGEETMLFSTDNLLENCDQSEITGFTPLSDGNFAFSLSGGSNPNVAYEPDDENFDWEGYYENYENVYSLQVLDASGRLQWETEISGYCQLQADGQGNILAFFSNYDEETGEQSNSAVMYDTSGNGTEITSGLETIYSIDNSVRASDGSVYLMASGDTSSNVFLKWNVEQKKFEEFTIDTNNRYFYGFIPSMQPEIPFYIYDEKGIYAVSSDGTLLETVNFIDSDLSGSKFNGAIGLADGTFIAILYDNDYHSYFGKLTLNENADNVEVLTLATYYLDSDLGEKIAAFNNSQDEYRISVKDYSEYNDNNSENEDDWNKGILVFDEDIAAGNIPDLVELSSFNAVSYAEKGLLLNLYDFMEKDDTYTKNAFLPNYLAANEIDGGVYWLTGGISLYTILVNTELTGRKTSWTLQEFVDICRDCNDKGISIFENQTPERFLDQVIFGSNFVDITKGECHFDDPAFVELLKLSQEITSTEPDYESMTDSEWDAYYAEETMKYMNGETLMYSSNYYAYQDYAMSKAFFGNKSTTLIGFPTVDGKNSSSLMPCQGSIGITTACKAPEVAWDFVCSFIEMDVDRRYSYPITVDQLEEYFDYDLERLEQTVEGGYTYNNVELDLQMPTEQELETFRDFLTSVDRISMNDSTMTNMIYEVLQDFYDGHQTAEETASLLQQKCNLYLKENG